MQQERENFINFMPELNVNDLVVIDESGFPLNMTKPYGRCDKSERLKLPAPMHGKNISAIGAIDINGVVDVVLVEGSIDKDCVETFIKDALLPKLETLISRCGGYIDDDTGSSRRIIRLHSFTSLVDINQRGVHHSHQSGHNTSTVSRWTVKIFREALERAGITEEIVRNLTAKSNSKSTPH